MTALQAPRAMKTAHVPAHFGPVYLDHAAATTCDPRVVEAMLPWLLERSANAGQAHHGPGHAAGAAVDRARAAVLRSIGMTRLEGRVTFTSGATEANNIALLGLRHRLDAGSRALVSATEHASVLAPAQRLASWGVDVQRIPVDRNGVVRLEWLERELHAGAAVVSVQAVNNETGVAQPINDILELVSSSGALLHVDAAQAWGKIPIDAVSSRADLLTLSGHKVGGPPGIGALVSRVARTRPDLEPLVVGGGQEQGLRAGTVPVALVAGLGAIADIIRRESPHDAVHARALQDQLETGIARACPHATVNGGGVSRSPYISSVTFPGNRSADLLARMPDVAASTTSACSSGRPSHVLSAMGMTDAELAGTIRLGIGRSTTADVIEAFLARLADALDTST